MAAKKSFFGRLQSRIEDAILNRPSIDDELLEELEEILITSDIGMETTEKIVEQLRKDVKSQALRRPEDVKSAIRKIVEGMMDKGDRLALSQDYPLVIVMIGVNGSGKTTTIGKLAWRFRQQGKTVLLAAADTFRAAASEQLTIWGQRVGVNVVRHGEGADPSAVIYDAIQSAKAKKVDVLICDTAGRLQTQRNLMSELEKMYKVIGREYPEASKECLLVIDAGTGKNALSQAEQFSAAAQATGVVLTKLDGSAKGGIVITIAEEYDLPVKFIGVGEGMEDLQPFDPKAFAAEIFPEE